MYFIRKGNDDGLVITWHRTDKSHCVLWDVVIRIDSIAIIPPLLCHHILILGLYIPYTFN